MNWLVSIIVPVYKVEAYLDKCVETILAQTYKNLEIILVDDGSPDACPEMCDKWAKRDNRIKAVHKKNGGLSDARNAGIDIAKGDYLLFVDSDDWIEQNMVETMLLTAKEENADICACGIMYEYHDHKSPLSAPYFVGNSQETLRRLYQDTLYPVAAWNKLYRRNCWDTLRFPVGKLCEDAFTTYVLIDMADRIVQIPDTFYHYRIRENSIMTAAFSHQRMDEEEAWRCNYQFIERNYPDLKKNARNFYLERVNHLIQTIPKGNEQFAADYDLLKRIRNKSMPYIIFKSGMPLKKRARFIIDYLRE